ncbi:hypothetical protein CDV31_008676 [Fusarium ambrosium]|uniref:PX domain-containing protein n=1 Tax=Fusarium ambrosium TaxID=131363 RepID=A0A428TZ68_9HYPO|nr:hypothetical protein CDV31_008676 [Fusarium ambrosium]
MGVTGDDGYPLSQNNQDEEEPVIYSLVHQCRQWLESLSRHLGSTTNWQHHLLTIDDSQGRFSVWANNMVTLTELDSTNSLDHGLRDGMRMRKNVMQALMDIMQSAERAIEIATGVLPNRTNESYEPFMSPSTDEPSLGTTQFDPLPAITRFSAHEPVTTELDELLSSIQASVDRLFRLSMLIRRSRNRARLSAETRAPSMDIRHVKDKFPKLKETEWLAERLGTAIATRRAFIKSRQSHHQRLAEQSQGSAEGGKTRLRRAISNPGEGPAGIEWQTDKLDRLSVISGATSFATAPGDDNDGNLRVPDLTRLKFHGTQLEYGSPFECPFCGTTQVISSEHEWRKHVFTDLRLYVCTFENCSSDPFSSRHEWFNHELEFHRKQWRCTQCSGTTFNSAAGIRDHFAYMHPVSFGNSQWSWILKACELPLGEFYPSSCPLCFFWIPPVSKGYNAEAFCRHLGSHLQQLALTALPIAIEGLEILKDEGGDKISEASYSEEDAEETEGSNVPASGPHVLWAKVPAVYLDKQSGEYVFIVEACFVGVGVWELIRPYEDFYDLQINLLAEFPREAGNTGDKRTLPYMPGPVDNVTEEISRIRRVNLDAYLCKLVDQPAHISRSNVVGKFFTPRERDQILTTNEYLSTRRSVGTLHSESS